MIKIKKGLNLPISGVPDLTTSDQKTTSFVALLGDDYQGLRPTMMVKVGDKVKLGQVIFTDKKMPKIQYTAPAAGEVTEINRGHKRVFQSLVIKKGSTNDEVTFHKFSKSELSSIGEEKVKEILLQSGQWTSLRARPYSKVADPDSKNHSIFITATDTNPLAADPLPIIEKSKEDFESGLEVISQLTQGKVYLCTSQKISLGVNVKNLEQHTFTGIHPAGLVGTHIHFLDPVDAEKVVWHINYQDVIAIGHLFTTGKIFTERWISLAGPRVTRPRLIKTHIGAKISELGQGELKEGPTRLISGSVLSGRTAHFEFDYLGKFHHQVSAIEEDDKRVFLGWHSPGMNKFSVKNIFLSKLSPGKKFAMTSSTEGSLRSIVPIGSYEKVMPLDLLPTYLLRAICAKDTERANELGCLELDEEDLALCTFVCPSKIEYGPILRENLTTIEKEG